MRTILILLGLGVLAAVAVPNFQHGGCRRSPTRRCYANQKTIAGAIEMFNLDFNTNVTGLTPWLKEALVKFGYLQEFPRDPVPWSQRDDPDAPRGEYVLIQSSGNGVACTRHGAILSPDGDSWDREDWELLQAERTGLDVALVRRVVKDLAELEVPPPPPPRRSSWF